MALSPASQVQLYYKATPFAVTLNLTNASNVGAYQFRLTWDPAKLQWAGSDMATVTWLSSTGRGPSARTSTEPSGWLRTQPERPSRLAWVTVL